jgi:hypothetical protein
MKYDVVDSPVRGSGKIRYRDRSAMMADVISGIKIPDSKIAREAVFLRRPTPRRAPRRLIADGRDAGAHSAFGRRYLTPIECMSKWNF